MTNITTRNNKIQTTDNKIQARDRSFKPFGVYRNSVLSLNNTQIASDVNTRLLYKWLIDNNLYDDLVLAVGGDYGIQKNYVNTNWQVENAYDLSKFSNDTGQGTPALQPINEANRWLFNDETLLIGDGNPASLQFHDDITMLAWVNVNTYKDYGAIMGAGYLGATFNGKGLYVNATSIVFQVRMGADRATVIMSVTPSGWVFLAATFTVATSTSRLIINMTDEGSATNTDVTDTTPNSTWQIGRRTTVFPFEGYFGGGYIFRKILTDVELLSFYNQTKGKYGY